MPGRTRQYKTDALPLSQRGETSLREAKVPGGVRTHDLVLRRHTRYPAAPLGHTHVSNRGAVQILRW
jgi:hypothetical protein